MIITDVAFLWPKLPSGVFASKAKQPGIDGENRHGRSFFLFPQNFLAVHADLRMCEMFRKFSIAPLHHHRQFNHIR